MEKTKIELIQFLKDRGFSQKEIKEQLLEAESVSQKFNCSIEKAYFFIYEDIKECGDSRPIDLGFPPPKPYFF